MSSWAAYGSPSAVDDLQGDVAVGVLRSSKTVPSASSASVAVAAGT